jgi:hypothetical protein
MLTIYHTQICRRALENEFSPRALEAIIAANIAQDSLRGQIGHPEYHFDDNAFAAGYAYMEKQRQIILKILSAGGATLPAWEAFGRLTHAAQDFYAHSNFLTLWAESIPGGELPSPSDVDALLPKIIQHPDLRSGRIYPLEALAFIPALRPLTRRILPPDSHAHMNLDYPERGLLFPYVIEAAVNRTRHEFSQITQQIQASLSPDALTNFFDK